MLTKGFTDVGPIEPLVTFIYFGPQGYHMEEVVDIHRFDLRMASIEKKISKDRNILPSNRKKIMEFEELCIACGLKPSTITKDLHSLWFIGTHISKPFKRATKKDIIKLCRDIKSQSWTEKTKRTHQCILKKFYKWLYGMEQKGQYPEIVAWVETTERKDRNKFPDIITEEELEQMLQAADNPRDKALTLLLFETGARIGELLNIKLKHIAFQDNVGFISLNGKTGPRRVTVVASVPILASHIDMHPFKDDPESFLFLTKFNNMEGRTGYTQLSYRGANKALKTLAKEAGIKRRVYPHLFRHSSATRAAKFLTEAQMKQYYGWTRGSNMPEIYVHLSQRDTEDAIKRMNGMDAEKAQQAKAVPTKCRTCKQMNSPGSRFCNVCGAILSLEAATNVNALLQKVMRQAPDLFSKSDEEILREHESKKVQSQ
ncbi:tyrosine-type recombinase/integrase [Candidatus Poribacteria bacterium]